MPSNVIAMLIGIVAMIAITGNDWGWWHMSITSASWTAGAGITAFVIVIVGWLLDPRW